MFKINSKPALGIIFAICAAVSAFVTEIDNQRKDREIEDMKMRISKLEKGETE